MLCFLLCDFAVQSFFSYNTELVEVSETFSIPPFSMECSGFALVPIQYYITKMMPCLYLRYRDAPGNALRCTYEGTLRDLLIYYKPRGPKKLYYQVLTIPIDQLENKRQFKCVWVANQFKDERELVLFPNKDGTVSDLLNEAREQVDLQPDGTGKLRLLEIISSKVFTIVGNDVPLEHLTTQAQRTFRIEVSLHEKCSHVLKTSCTKIT